jgi:hypothetical protein
VLFAFFRVKNFAENEEFSEFALQRRKEEFALGNLFKYCLTSAKWTQIMSERIKRPITWKGLRRFWRQNSWLKMSSWLKVPFGFVEFVSSSVTKALSGLRLVRALEGQRVSPRKLVFAAAQRVGKGSNLRLRPGRSDDGPRLARRDFCLHLQSLPGGDNLRLLLDYQQM